MTRWTALYARSRRLPAAIAISAVAVAVVAGAWRLFSDSPATPANLAVGVGLLVLAPLIPTLSGDDDALESTAALPWPPRRAAHLVALFAGGVALLAVAAALGCEFGTGWQIVRNGAGLTGLIGLGAALIGTQLAWLVPVVWTGIQVMGAAAAAGGGVGQQLLLWQLQPDSSRAAAVLAAVLAVAGLLTYAIRGCPRRSAGEATIGQ
ncbi:hypothetical protein [Actinoplanes sp. N902-109]|uniref:hypothetical protein n=1 Tax=Actinoplanes sp. (strain N902-109) TaxID=649831 RepID=UPI0003293C23|nr:hypothetical protein [Actinoplanes sp. N902-109]AGL13994.1 hypothetical protein L083_0484 [Actinoplanes sp. N902-109]